MLLCDVVLDLCARNHEEEWFEFKENWFDPIQLGEYISALSNSAAVFGKDNAYFVWGVNDKTHDIVGTSIDFNKDYKGEPVQNFLARSLKPSLAFEFHELFINNNRVVVLVIPSAKRVPTSFCKDRFFRISSSKVNLDNYPEREALVWKVLSEGYPTMINTESPIQDLTFDKLKIYYTNNNLHFNDNFRINLKLYTPNGKYNMLACYLADNGNIPVRVAIFSGKSKAEKLFSVKEFGNESLVTAIDRIIDYSKSINISRAIEHLETGFREDVPLFDQECFNEAVKNAFIHNNWTHRAAPMITFFDDRIEITSFSSLAPNQTIEGFFRGESKPVNEDLSVIFLSTHLSERTGKGVPLIVSRYGREAFEINENSIKVTLPYNWKYKFEADLIDNPIDKLVDKLTNNEIIILKKIKDNPRMSQPEIASLLGMGKTTIQNAIVKFKKLNLIERIGSNKTGYWKVNI